MNEQLCPFAKGLGYEGHCWESDCPIWTIVTRTIPSTQPGVHEQLSEPEGMCAFKAIAIAISHKAGIS